MHYEEMELTDMLDVSCILHYCADDVAAIAAMLDNARIAYDDDHRRLDDYIRITIMSLSSLAISMNKAAENAISRNEG